MSEIAEQGYNEVADTNSGGGSTLTQADLAAITAIVEAALVAASASSIIVRGGSVAMPAGCVTDGFNNILLRVGDDFSLDIACQNAQGAALPLTGWTVTASTTAQDGSAVSTAIACTIAYGRGGVVTYPLQAADTENSGTYYLTITAVNGSQKHSVVACLVVS